MIKAARRYGEAAGRYAIVTLKNSFHGRTIATLAATGQDAFHRHFGPFPDGLPTRSPTIWRACGRWRRNAMPAP